MTAVESGYQGIGYWADVRNYRLAWLNEERHVLAGASVEVRERDTDQKEWKIVNLDTVRAGITKISNGSTRLNKQLTAAVLLAAIDPVMHGGEIDAEIADCIIQAGLLGDIVYG